MPELPEVEVMCRSIRPHLLGRRVLGVAASDKKLRQPIPLDSLRRELPGKTIVEVGRRAKFLQIQMDSGAMLIIHLGMTGNLSFFPVGAPLAKHDHLRLTLDNGSELRYSDSRRFGLIRTLTASEAEEVEQLLFHDIGPEPFDRKCSGAYFEKLAQRRAIPVKVFLMTPKVVAGVGNIYASESLFRAGILPQRPSASLSRGEWARLIKAVREVLNEAINCGGSTISTFLDANRERGYFQMNFSVYDREGEPCLKCGKAVAKIRLGGRSSFFCGKCQR